MLFASPWYLLGALAAGIPVLIHLYGRRRARRVPFPSLMLLQAAQRERTSLVRLRQLWLMILRAAALLMLSLALARPSVRAFTTAVDTDSLAVIVIDDSLSMRTRNIARSRFEQARVTARRLLDGLGTGQPAALAVASRPAEPVLGSARTLPPALDRLQPSYGFADMPDALARLAETLRPQGYPRHRWYVLTDLQASGWLSPAGRSAADRVTLIDCGQETPNRALSGIEVTEPPPLVGRPVQLAVQARQFGALRGEAQVRVRIGNGALPPAPLAPAARSERVLFDWQPEHPGLQGLTATLPPDPLREDDSVYAVLDVRDRLEVALAGTEAQTRWARLALAPGSLSRLRVTDRLSPASTDAALLWQLTDLSVLQQTAETGAGMLVFLETVTPAQLRALVGDAATLGALRTLPEGLHFSSFEVFGPPLQAFSNPAAGDLQEPSFRRVRRLSLPPGSPLQVIARYGDGTPALLRGRLGNGRLLLANFGVAPDSSDLPAQPVFVPLLHRLVGYLARPPWPGAETSAAGTLVRLPPPPSGEAPRATGPDAQPPVVSVTSGSWDLPVALPGLYRLQWRQQGRERSQLLAVNVDPAESDPRRLSPAEVVRRLQPAQATVLTPEQALSRRPRAALSLATPLLLLALILLLAELWLTTAEGRSKEPSA